jgi:cell division protein FtsW (lipid II flippase)
MPAIMSPIQDSAGSGRIRKGISARHVKPSELFPTEANRFIFTTLAKEFGLLGGTCLIALYPTIIAHRCATALRSRNGLRADGNRDNQQPFLYVFINVAMVQG